MLFPTLQIHLLRTDRSFIVVESARGDKARAIARQSLAQLPSQRVARGASLAGGRISLHRTMATASAQPEVEQPLLYDDVEAGCTDGA